MISIIVPIYNAEKTLKRCIESIMSQTVADFELLLVDDGSKDGSGNICDEYAKADNRVRVFHKQNGGVSSARNLGLDNARGEWVAFVDSDDWVDKDYLRNFVAQLAPDTELVLQSFWFDWENGKKEMPVILPEQEMTGNYRLVQWLEDAPGVHNGFIWHRLFKCGIINQFHIRFAEGISFAEDGWFFFQYLKTLHHFKMTSRPGYHYYIRKGSLTSIGKKVPISIHEKVLRAYITSLYDFQMPIEDREEHINFTRRYIWRLAESWFIRRAMTNAKEKSECLRIMDDVCNKYEIDKVHKVPLTLQCLIRLSRSENSKCKDLLLQMILFIRKYEQKIRRHL